MNVGSALSRWESIQADMNDMQDRKPTPSNPHSQASNLSNKHLDKHLVHQSIDPSPQRDYQWQLHPSPNQPNHRHSNYHPATSKFQQTPSLSAISESPSKSENNESNDSDMPPIIQTPSLPDMSINRLAEEVFRESNSQSNGQSNSRAKGLLHVYDSFPVLAKPEEHIEPEDDQPSDRPSTHPIKHHIDLDAIVLRFARNFAKGCSIGFAAKSGFALIGLLIKFKFNLRMMWLKNQTGKQSSNQKWSSMLGKALVGEPLAYGAFLGCILAIYQTIKRSFPQLSVNQSNHQSIKYSILLTDLIACALIAPSINLLPRSHRASIALFFFVRSMECLSRFYAVRYREQSANQANKHAINNESNNQSAEEKNVKRYRIADMMKKFQQNQSSTEPTSQSNDQSNKQTTNSELILQRYDRIYDHSLSNKIRLTVNQIFDVTYRWMCKNSELLVFCSAAGPICWAALYSTDSLDPGYYHFMRIHGGRSDASLTVAADLHHAINVHQAPFPQALRVLNDERNRSGLKPLEMSDPWLHCKVIHGDEHCLPALLTFYRSALKRALPVYVPVYVLPLLLFRLSALKKQPLTTLLRLAQNIGQSTIFLACYCSVGWTWMCLFRSVHSPYGRQSHAAISGFLSGLTLLMEKPSRRIELCLYVAGHALFACYRALMTKRKVPNMPNGLMALFGASLMMILTVHHSRYAQQAIRPTYQSLLKYFFDLPGTMSSNQSNNQSIKQTIKPSGSSTSAVVNGHSHDHSQNGHSNK